MNLKYVLILFIVLTISSCKESEKDLLIAINKIEKSWSDDQIQAFKKLSESDHNSNFEYGHFYKENVLLTDKDSVLIKYFHSKNIYNTNNMVNIIFTTLHRELNDKPLNLDEQFNSYKE